MNALDVTDLSKSYGPQILLDGVSFTVGEEEKVGVVGRNGCGKSTLFRVLAGLEDTDGGRIATRRGLTFDYLPQKPQLDPTRTVRQTLETYLGEGREKLHRYQQIAAALETASPGETHPLLDEQHQVQGWLDLHGAWNLDHRVEEICTQFGIDDLERRVGELSGGWSQRVALAGVLLRQPDLLLLDEPTNQLDAETVAWLEEHLKACPGAVLLVTHDRYFLDRVVDRMFELEAGHLTAYTGGYSAYVEQKQERLLLEDRQQTRLLNLLRREEAWLRRGAPARTTKQKARIDRVEKLRDQKTTGRQREVELEFRAAGRLGGTILEARKLGVAFGETRVFSGVDLTLRKGERIGILGPNGCGKTTLVRTLLGQLEPTRGEVVVGKNTRIGYLDQQRSGLDPEQLVEEALGDGEWVDVGGTKRRKIGYLEDFLFPRPEQGKRISTLSGGERARLLLARLVTEGANLLVLDEPTVDLDLPTLQVLDEALRAFAGCVLVVTHDRYFLDRVATGILHFEGEDEVVFYEGNYDVFQRLHARRVEVQREEEKAALPAAAPKPRAAKRKQGLSYKEQQELEGVEQEIATVEERQAEVEALLADASNLAGGHERLRQLTGEYAELETRLSELLERWEQLEEKR
jgi:ATP-binding cassette subfamily F protein uup